MKIGFLIPRSGPAAIWRVGCEGCAMLAVAEINEEGGVLGAPAELLLEDAGADPAEAAQGALRLLAAGADAVVGMQLSHQRIAVRRALAGRVPYIYTPHYEGGWCGPATIPLGLGDDEAMPPALDHLVRRAGARRIYFAGSDYVWPRAAHASFARAVRDAGAAFAGESLAPIGTEDFAPMLSRIRHARPDAVVAAFIGEDAVHFHRAFAAVGLAPRVARLAMAFDETLLWAIGPENAEGLHAVQPYFDGAPPPAREAMLERHRAAFGVARPPVNALGLGSYDGVRLAATLARRAGRRDGATVARGLPDRFGRAAAHRLLGLPTRARGGPCTTLAEADGVRFRPLATA